MTQPPHADAESSTSGKSNFEVLESRVVNVDFRVGHIEEDLREIKEDYRTISTQLRELRSLVLEKKPDYKAMLIAASAVIGVFVTIAGALWTQAIDPIRTDISSIRNKIEQIVPRETHVLKWADDDKNFARIDQEIDELKKQKLDRIDVEMLKAQLSAKIDELNARLKRH